MHCPKCESASLRVIDSRDNDGSIRRRRECGDCSHRFTTHERIDRFTCPACESSDSRVSSVEVLVGGLHRRRECSCCGHRYMTVERPDISKLLVVKHDGRRQEFDSAKIFEGVRIACQNRPVSVSQIQGLVERITEELTNSAGDEVLANRVGELVMGHLRDIDEVAYVRFASVYRRFDDVDRLSEAVDEIKAHRRRQKFDEVQPRLIPDEE